MVSEQRLGFGFSEERKKLGIGRRYQRHVNMRCHINVLRWQRSATSSSSQQCHINRSVFLVLLNTMATWKSDMPLFDRKMDFTLWQCTIQDFLVQQGLDSALLDEKPIEMKESEWSTIQKKVVSTI